MTKLLITYISPSKAIERFGHELHGCITITDKEADASEIFINESLPDRIRRCYLAQELATLEVLNSVSNPDIVFSAAQAIGRELGLKKAAELDIEEEYLIHLNS